MTRPDDSHLIVADTHPIPDEVTSYREEVLRRDVADQALCGWKLPHKYFSRIMWQKEEEVPGRGEPSDVCPECLQVVIAKNINSATLCLTPPESWDWEG